MVKGEGKKRSELPEAPARRAAPACLPPTPGMRAAGAALALIIIGLILAAMGAAFDLLPGNAGAPILSFWWWYAGISAVLMTAETLARAAIPREERRVSCRGDPGLPRLRRILKFLWRALPLVLLAGGHYGLAALVAFLLVLGIARHVEDRRILGEIDEVDPAGRAIHGAVFAIGERAAPATRAVGRLLGWKVGRVPVFGILLSILLLPLILVVAVVSIPFWVYGVVRSGADATRRERDLVRATHAGGTLAWFAYAEAHQREHFLGPGGVLHEVADRVIVRDWRRGLQARAHGVEAGDADDLDGVVLKHLNLTNMREDLPVLVFFEAHGRMAVYRLNRAYRRRLRDGGDLLAQLEEGMRLQLERAALPA